MAISREKYTGPNGGPWGDGGRDKVTLFFVDGRKICLDGFR